MSAIDGTLQETQQQVNTIEGKVDNLGVEIKNLRASLRTKRAAVAAGYHGLAQLSRSHPVRDRPASRTFSALGRARL